MTVGQRICQRRTELGWTQEELAIKMGYKTRNAIYQYEKAENMKLSLIEKFAKVLGCTTSYLMGWEEPDATTAEDMLIEAYKKRATTERLLAYFMQLNPEQQESVLNLIKNMV